MDIETIKHYLENNGVLCQIRNRHYTYHPELDYEYIKCYKDGLEFETTFKEGDLPVIQFVCILNGQRYGLNRMFSPMELANDLVVDYIIGYSVDYFINNIKQNE